METKTKTEVKIRVRPEGREDIWLPEKKSLKAFLKAKKIKSVHNFMPRGQIILGADHDIKSVLEDIDDGDRLAVFTSEGMNMGHALAIVKNEKLECYDIGRIQKSDLEIIELK